MNINKHNYEAFFLDYHEGNLTPQQVADLLLFIEQHPEVKEEFENFENITIAEYSQITFENKSELKKEINSGNKEEYFIKSVEGTLTPAESVLLNNYIKQHPQDSIEFALFQKTKLFSDNTIVFEGKEALKQIAISSDNLLIASVEGLLTNEEEKLLNQRIKSDFKLQKELLLYKQTKLVADPSIIFENKNELKQKERKIIPLFYYAAIAATILLLFGLFFIFNYDPKHQKLALKNNSETQEPINNQVAKITDQKLNEKTINNLSHENKQNLIAKKSAPKKQNKTINKNDDQLIVPVMNEEQTIAQNKKKNEEVPANKELAAIENQATKNEKSSVNNQQPIPNNPEQSAEFLSLREIAAAKIKEKTLDADVLAEEKKNGRMKKISGWDVVQILAKGASKLTGKKVEAKPTYNEEGEVTAYALGAGGFQFSRGK